MERVRVDLARKSQATTDIEFETCKPLPPHKAPNSSDVLYRYQILRFSHRTSKQGHAAPSPRPEIPSDGNTNNHHPSGSCRAASSPTQPQFNSRQMLALVAGLRKGSSTPMGFQLCSDRACATCFNSAIKSVQCTACSARHRAVPGSCVVCVVRLPQPLLVRG